MTDEITPHYNLRTGDLEIRPVPEGSTEIGEFEAAVSLYYWKQYWRYGDDMPGSSEPIKIGGVWHSAPWRDDSICGACGGRATLLTEASGWTIPSCSRRGLHDSLSTQDHLDIQRHRDAMLAAATSAASRLAISEEFPEPAG